MPLWRDVVCPHCGLKYRDLRTNLSYDDILGHLYSPDPDPDTWRYRRRGTVLGVWFQIKQDLWEQHLRWHEEGEEGAGDIEFAYEDDDFIDTY